MKTTHKHRQNKTIEQQIEDEIRTLKALIDQLPSCPGGIPANQNIRVRDAFNSRSGDLLLRRYLANLARRMGLERMIEENMRRLNGLRTNPAPALI